MLSLAILHRDDLQRKYAACAYNEKYKYSYGANWCRLELTIKDSTWDCLQCVSLEDNEVVGFFEASFNRTANSVNCIYALNFTDSPFPFAKDLRLFLTRLFDQCHVQKVRWTVSIGNPAERMYDRIVRKYGGRVVGIYHREDMLWDGELCDCKLYEILREEYERMSMKG